MPLKYFNTGTVKTSYGPWVDPDQGHIFFAHHTPLSPLYVLFHYQNKSVKMILSYESSLACVTNLVLKWLMAKKSYVPLTSRLSSSLNTGRLWKHTEENMAFYIGDDI